MSKRYDIAIIGTGAAGLSAALNAKIRNQDFIIFGSKDMSGKLTKAHKINNYLGFYQKSGREIRDEFSKHLTDMGIKITEEKINNVYAMGEYYTLMAGDKSYEATSVIISTGVNFGKPLPREEEFLGRGVSYCATCDGALYKDKIVAVVAYDKKEEAEANFLAGLADKVYYIPMYKEEVTVDSKIEVLHDIPLEIKGDKLANKVVLKNQELNCDGIFILRESVAPAQLVPGLKMDKNHIEVDRLMKTNLEGCFAAGDIVGVPYQYIKAAGEGNIAALSAVAYVDNLKRQNKLNDKINMEG